ncbi:hypothetical protein [Streptomyces violascens]|uniref:hypothetical protein n=1 Tax=Streptomyces violascens TaxID=67381 RepID=UPI0036C0F579
MTARERLLSYALSATPNEVTIAKCEELADAYRDEVRAEVAADVHRAGLPSFPAGERPELVAKTVRAVDVRIAEQGTEAPYGVAARPLTPHAELAQVRARLNAVLDICDREERNAVRWENPIPVPEWVAEVQRAALGDAAGRAE